MCPWTSHCFSGDLTYLYQGDSNWGLLLTLCLEAFRGFQHSSSHSCRTCRYKKKWDLILVPLLRKCHVLKSNFLKSSYCDLGCINIDKCNYKKTRCSWRSFPPLVIPGENPWPYYRNPGVSWSFWHRKGQHGCVPQGQQSPPCSWDLHLQRTPRTATLTHLERTFDWNYLPFPPSFQ